MSLAHSIVADDAKEAAENAPANAGDAPLGNSVVLISRTIYRHRFDDIMTTRVIARKASFYSLARAVRDETSLMHVRLRCHIYGVGRRRD